MFCLIKKDVTNITSLRKYAIHENEQFFYLPRHIKRYYDNPNIITYRDPKFNFKRPYKFNFISPLRDSQVQMSADFMQVFERDGFINGIAHARPGSGKTVLGIYLAHLTNLITLIVIDNRKIVSQWKEEILRHTDLDESKIGLIKGDVFDVEDKTIIITTPQTLASKFKNDRDSIYPLIREIGIGLVVWDEAHKIADKWATGTFLMNTPNLIGLTATPFHDKDKAILMHSIFGEIETTYGEYDFSPSVKFIHYDSGLDIKHGSRTAFMWEKNFNAARSMYNKALCQSSIWVNTCVDIMEKSLNENVDNRMIVIVFTKEQLELLYNTAVERGLSPVKLYSKENAIDKENDRLIIATQKYASEAFDYKQLNRLLIAVPLLGRKSLIQTIGRILRECEGKLNAIVYDLIDIGSKFRGIFTSSVPQKIRILQGEYEECKFENIT